jgi:hypothetical protein
LFPILPPLFFTDNNRFRRRKKPNNTDELSATDFSMASAISERVELAKLCSSRDWSKAIRVLDSLLVQSCAIQDIWSVRSIWLIFNFLWSIW